MSYVASEGQSFFDVVLQLVGDVDRMGEVLAKTRNLDNVAAFTEIDLDKDTDNENVQFFESKSIVVVSAEQEAEDDIPDNALIDLDNEVLIDFDGEILIDLS